VATSRIELSSTVLSVWGRSPGTLAMTAVSLQGLSGGRFVLGLGASTQPLAEGFHGAPWISPVAHLAETLASVRALLDGDRLPQPAEGARPLRLGLLPEHRVPLAVAALGPLAVRVTGQYADRWLPFLWPLGRLDEGRDLLAEGRRNRDVAGDVEVHPSVPLALAEDEAGAAALAARWLVTYCTRMGPLYPSLLRDRFGYATEVDALLEANTDPRRPVLPRAAERLAREVTVLATYDEAPQAVAEWQSACDGLALSLPFGTALDGLEAAVAALAPSGPSAP
jgi:alkanesulfonate monooxygenase SsuD/methylene tetrahydromethanopterin reductase-like flavin-dependent oxidoreductase (luciferase family)